MSSSVKADQRFQGPATRVMVMALGLFVAAAASYGVAEVRNERFTDRNTEAPNAVASTNHDQETTPEDLAAAPPVEPPGRLHPHGYREVSATEAVELLADHQLVDVREPAELHGPLGALPGVRNIPLGTLPAAMDSLPEERPLLLICRSGNRSGHACARVVNQTGRPCTHVQGGMIAMQRVLTAGSNAAAR